MKVATTRVTRMADPPWLYQKVADADRARQGWWARPWTVSQRSCRSRIRQLLCYRPEAGRSLSCARQSKGYAMAFARIVAAAGIVSMLIGTTTIQAAEIVVVST